MRFTNEEELPSISDIKYDSGWRVLSYEAAASVQLDHLCRELSKRSPFAASNLKSCFHVAWRTFSLTCMINNPALYLGNPTAGVAVNPGLIETRRNKRQWPGLMSMAPHSLNQCPKPKCKMKGRERERSCLNQQKDRCALRHTSQHRSVILS